MNEVRRALYTALTTNGALTALLSAADAVHHERADEDAQLPYIVFQKYDGRASRTYGASANRIDQDIWLVKAIVGGESASQAEDIAAAIDAVLDRAALVVTGRRTLVVERQSDVDYPEDEGDVTYHHCGALYRVWTQPS